ncbi:DUF317 domain-containing protein [Streptomyces violens]|uniref:DUF317 domain-containing protein n=1 Tax=Streptomyces violens TaxID=66377 RepID=UPI0009966730
MPTEYNIEHWNEYRVTPRYLAGSGYAGDPGLEPVAHWPHHTFDDGPCQLLVTSPDHRIKIGWFGDNYDLWKITAAQDAVSPPRWQATFNHAFPPEIVVGLTSALAEDWSPESDRFLTPTSVYWADSVQPLLDAGWTHGPAERGTVEVLAPDRQAGVFIDRHSYGRLDERVLLWSGPQGWATRAEASFSVGTPHHLIAATAAAMSDPTPVVRERHMLHRDIEHLVRLNPVKAEASSHPRAPTPLEAKQTAVTAAVQRAADPAPSGPMPPVSAPLSPTRSRRRHRRHRAPAATLPPARQPAPDGERPRFQPAGEHSLHLPKQSGAGRCTSRSPMADALPPTGSTGPVQVNVRISARIAGQRTTRRSSCHTL